MRPLLLEMENFRSFHQKTVIDFEYHIQSNELFLITGDTGSGKSTILDAMMYALYATTPTGNSRDVLKSQYYQQGEASEVRFVFQLNHRYEVYRSLKATSKDYLKKDGELIASKSKEVTNTIRELIGLTDKQFQNVIVLPQGKLDQFLVAKEKEKKDILRTIFQLGQLKTIADKIKEKHKVLDSEMNMYYSQMATHLQRLVPDGDIDDFLSSWHDNKESLVQDVQDYKENYAKRVAKQKDEQQELSQEIHQLQQQLNEQQRVNEAIQKEDAQKEIYQELCAKERQLADKKSKVTMMTKLMYHGVFNVYDQWEKQKDDVQRRQKKYDDYVLQQREVQAFYEQHEKEWLKQKDAYYKQQVILTKQLSVVSHQLQITEQVMHIEEAETQQRQKNQTLNTQEEDLKATVHAQRQKVEKKDVWEEKLHHLTSIIEQNEQQLAQYITWLEVDQQEMVAQQKLQRKEDAYQKAKVAYQNDYDAYTKCEREFIQASASRLAATLEEGQPCPVCGSCDHPNITPSLEAISEQLLLKQKDELAKKEDELARMSEMMKKEREQLQSLQLKKAQCGLAETTTEEIKATYEALVNTQNDTIQQKDELARQLADIAQLEHVLALQDERLTQLTLAKQEGDQQLNQLQGQLQSLRNEYDGTSVDELNEMQQQYAFEEEQIKAELAAIETKEKTMQEQLTELATKVATTSETLSEMKREQESLRQTLEHQFIENQLDKQTFLTLFEERQYYNEWQKTIDHITKEKERVEQSLRDLAGIIAGRHAKDLAEDEQRLHEKQEEEKHCNQVIGEEAKQFEVNIQTIDALFESCQHYDDVNQRYEPLKRLGDLWTTNGRGSGIETFIMGHYFKQMIQQANYYLLQFSRGRYRLKQDEDNILNLLINDGNTGQDRGVSTLSGGERFMCTLSLSLGMADVIGHRHSGVMINALFIDEGFGTLDEELLDQAMNLLYKVQKEQIGGMIGIISHIPTLRDNINHQLQVKTSDQGSRIHFVKK